MSQTEGRVAVMLADISGSTPLYESAGDAAALAAVGECLDALRAIIREEGGTFIHSKGDDVLCTFPDPPSALRAAREMLARQWPAPLAIHAGLHFGPVISARDDIFGDTVNLTARLAAMANPGEILVSESVVELLPGADSRFLQRLDTILLKGKSAPTGVYSLLGEDTSLRTQIAFVPPPGPAAGQNRPAAAGVVLTLRHADRTQSCREGASVSIGRSAECDLVLPAPWVSRNHAAVTVRGGKVQLSDRSSAGTYVSARNGHEFLLRRETVLLIGSGTLSPAMRAAEAGAEVIHYEIDPD